MLQSTMPRWLTGALAVYEFVLLFVLLISAFPFYWMFVVASQSTESINSVPPAIITSASPYSMRRPASPRLWLAVEQALTVPRFGPL